MTRLLPAFFSWFGAFFRSRNDLGPELVVLRHQLAVLKRKNPRPSGSFSSALLMILSNTAGTEALSCTGAVGARSLALWGFCRVHLARSFKCACDLDTEVAQYRRARLCRVVVEKNVVAISPQAWLAANELPDLA